MFWGRCFLRCITSVAYPQVRNPKQEKDLILRPVAALLRVRRGAEEKPAEGHYPLQNPHGVGAALQSVLNSDILNSDLCNMEVWYGSSENGNCRDN
jgi:hypothetical protein